MKLNKPPLIKYIIARALYAIYRRWETLVTKIKWVAYYHKFEELGDNVRIENRVTINKAENITIKEEAFIGQDSFLNAVEEITIGRYAAIAAGCRIMTWNHNISNRTTELRTTGKETAPVEINDGVWMGYDVIVLPGVTIGEGAVIAAGSVVTNDVGPFDVVAGSPASKIGERTDNGVKWIN